MKIAIFSDFFYPEISGISDSILLLGKELAKRGHVVMFVVPWYGPGDYRTVGAPRNDDFGPNIIVKRLPSFHLPFSPTKQMRVPLFLGLGIYWVKKFQPNIIHTHSPLSPGYEAWLASKIFKIPLVGTNHTPMSEYLNGPKWFIDFVCRHYAKFYNRCRFVTAPSRWLLEYMTQYGLTQKSKPISNPIDILNFSPAKSEGEKAVLKNRYGFSEKTVLYTGRLSKEKRVDDIIRAVAVAKKDLSNISLALVGHGKAENDFKKLAAELGVAEAVKFMGFISMRNLPPIYQASDLFAIMSTVETQSISLILGMASGLPAVGADSKALPEYINDSNGAIVPVGDYEALAREMVKILSNPDLTKKLGAGGTATAKKCSATSVAQEWEGIYQKAISGRF